MNAYYKAQFENLIQWVFTNQDRSVVVKEDGTRTTMEVNPWPCTAHPDSSQITMITEQQFNEQVLKANLRIAQALTN